MHSTIRIFKGHPCSYSDTICTFLSFFKYCIDNNRMTDIGLYSLSYQGQIPLHLLVCITRYTRNSSAKLQWWKPRAPSMWCIKQCLVLCTNHNLLSKLSDEKCRKLLFIAVLSVQILLWFLCKLLLILTAMLTLRKLQRWGKRPAKSAEKQWKNKTAFRVCNAHCVIGKCNGIGNGNAPWRKKGAKWRKI